MLWTICHPYSLYIYIWTISQYQSQWSDTRISITIRIKTNDYVKSMFWTKRGWIALYQIRLLIIGYPSFYYFHIEIVNYNYYFNSHVNPDCNFYIVLFNRELMNCYPCLKTDSTVHTFFKNLSKHVFMVWKKNHYLKFHHYIGLVVFVTQTYNDISYL